MRKILLLLSLMTAGMTAVHADNYGYFSFQSTDGTVQTFTAQGLEITYSNGFAIVKSGSSTASIALASLSGMSFSTEPGEVVEPGTETEVQQLSTASTTTYEVWTVSGLFVGRFSERTALQQLTHGVYVVRNNGKTQKMVLP